MLVVTCIAQLGATCAGAEGGTGADRAIETVEVDGDAEGDADGDVDGDMDGDMDGDADGDAIGAGPLLATSGRTTERSARARWTSPRAHTTTNTATPRHAIENAPEAISQPRRLFRSRT
jgi:hypothetical protein